jgi:hypothetical protein
MVPYVEDCYFYSRENNIIIANLADGGKIPLVKLHQKFIDIAILEGSGLEYMKKYMTMFPDLWECIKKEPKTNEQLKLF